ncbi:MAG: fused DSP-PTPase phosphatase/NAD kinase-like protein [Pyrinomonadaceae bacterium]
MNRVKNILFVLSLLLFWGEVQTVCCIAKENLPNFQQVETFLYRGGQPTQKGIIELKEKYGIKTIISLRSNDENAQKEAKAVEANSMKFINVALSNWFKPKKSEMDEIMTYVNDKENQPVFVHCKRGSDRTGTVIAVYRMQYQGWLPTRTLDEAKKYGIGWWQVWMKDFIKDYYRDYIAKPLNPSPENQSRFTSLDSVSTTASLFSTP